MFKFNCNFASIFLLCCLAFYSTGKQLIYDDIIFKKTTIEDGLSSEQVSDIIEDKYGFIWFGTTNGLNRFDGVDIKQFYHNTADTTTISDNDILCLHNGRNGDLWIGTYNGLNRYNFETGSFIRYETGNAPEGLVNGSVFSIYEDKNNFLWIGTEKGLNILNLKTNRIQHFSYLDKISGTGLLTILEDETGKMWFGTWDTGLHLLSSKKLVADTLQLKFNHFTVSNEEGGNKVWSLFLDDLNNLWIGTFGAGLFKLNVKNNKTRNLNEHDLEFTPYKRESKSTTNRISEKVITRITQDRNGYIWLATLDGIDLFNPIKNNQTFSQTFYNNFRKDGSLLHNEIWAVYIDKNEIIWIATSGGVCKYNPDKKKFNRYYPLKESSSERITTIATDSLGIHWLGTEHFGLIKYNPVTDTKEIFRTKQNTTPFKNVSVKQLKLNKDNLWVVTNKGLSMLNLKTSQLDNFSFYQDEDSLKKYPILVRNVLVDNQKNLWLSTLKGVIFIEYPSMEYTVINSKKFGLPSDDIFDIEEDKNGVIWIATFSGLTKLLVTDNDFQVERTFETKSASFNSADTNTITSNRIYSLLIDNNYLWLGTLNGLSQININNNDVTNHKLPLQSSKVIAGMNMDDEGNLWLMGKKTLSKYSPETGNHILFTANDGIHAENFEFNSQHISKSGEMFFAGAGGYTSFYPDSISLNKKVPEVFITDFKVFNKSLSLDKNILFNKEINISYKQNFISFEYMAMNYNQPEKNQYQYMLEGFDEDWVYAGHNKTATYTNLDGANYTFKVKASNNDGLWNEKGYSIKLNIKPPFWETWLFRLAAIALFLLAGVLILRWRTAHLKKRSIELIKFNKNLNVEIKERKRIQFELIGNKEKLQALVEELKRSNSNLQNFAYIASHDLNAPLRTVSSFITLLKRKYADKLDANGLSFIDHAMFGLRQMRNLVDSLLNFSKVGNDKDGYKNSDIKKIIEGKLFNLHALIQEKNAIVKLDLNDQPVFCEPEEIGIVFNNLINNGIKYNKNEKPTILVNQYEDENFWKFSIKDNGIGIEQKNQNKIFTIFQRLHNNSEFEGSGIGLSICQKIVDVHNGQIWLESKIGKGSTFYFTISKTIESRQQKTSDNNVSKLIFENQSN